METVMPPSGYSIVAVSSLVTFLRETLSDLKHEVAIGKHTSLEDGLRFEITQIASVMDDPHLRPCEKGALSLTKDFYRQVLLCGEVEALKMAEYDVTSLHPEDGEIKRR
jgi:hypothetical protein